MKNCILYKHITRDFLKQIMLTSVLLGSSVLFIFFGITEGKYSNENLGYYIFSLSIISFALMILISSFKGRTNNIKSLNTLITKKVFDEVIIESTKDEFHNPEKINSRSIPHLLFVKEKGEIVFRIMLKQKDIMSIFIFLKELKCNQEIKVVMHNKDKFNNHNYLNPLIPDVA